MRAFPSLLMPAALPLGALCLRLSERGPGPLGSSGANDSLIVPQDDDSAELIDQSLQDGSVDRGVLPIDDFRTVWAQRYSLESHLKEPLPHSVKLILGVFTVPQDAAYREVVRQTWLQQNGVCYWSHEPQESCSVYVAFVMGKSGSGERKGRDRWSDVHVSNEQLASAHSEPGAVVLNTVENMNEGKSLLWFSTAVKMFPWASHIAKMDMDTYPFLHKLLHRMDNRSCVDAMGPYEFIGKPQNSNGPVFSEACPYQPCDGQLSFVPHFLLGEFYIMSFPLAQKLTFVRGWRNEDIFMSGRVVDAAKANGFCVTLRHLDAWYHNNQMVNATYGNNF